MNKSLVLQTYKGETFDPASGDITRIAIFDIAHALAHLCRYCGHCQRFYSVAEHSVLVYKIIKKLWPDDLEAQWAGLLHDATEAYLGDITTPVKILIPQFNKMESLLAKKIANKFKIRSNLRIKARVRKADAIALSTEARELFTDVSTWKAIENVKPESALLDSSFPMSSKPAKDLFVTTYFGLKTQIAESREKRGKSHVKKRR